MQTINPKPVNQVNNFNIQACPASSFYDTYYRRCTITCPTSPPYYALQLSDPGICVLYCPNGTYANITTRSCGNACVGFYFVNNTGNNTQNICVDACPNNTYVDAKKCVLSISRK